jgi:hypothetical protein
MSDTTDIITTGENGEVYIEKLVVTDGNLPHAAEGEIVSRDEEGGLFTTAVDAEGGVTRTSVQVTGDNIADASVSGAKLEENAVGARELDIEGLFTDTTLWNRMIASSMDAEELMENEAFQEQMKKLEFESLNTTQQLRVGDFVLEQRQNGNLSLRRA